MDFQAGREGRRGSWQTNRGGRRDTCWNAGAHTEILKGFLQHGLRLNGNHAVSPENVYYPP